MLKQRIITALILLPLVLLLFFVVPLPYFAAVIGLIVFLTALEWAKLAGFEAIWQKIVFAAVVTAINAYIWLQTPNFTEAISISWLSQSNLVVNALYVGAVGVLVAILIALSYSKLPKWWANLWVRSLLGLAILPAFFVAIVSIRKVSYLQNEYYGGGLLLYMFCLIWAADTGAYFTGKAFGRTKLAPVVSPNKTWEGVAGGVAFSLLVGWSGALILELQFNSLWYFSFGLLILSAVSVLGDLFESALKRVSGIKDSGNLLPGHGGLFDRLDSTLAVAPLFYLGFSSMGWF